MLAFLKKKLSNLFTLLKSKVFLLAFVSLSLIALSIALWIYLPFLAFGDEYVFVGFWKRFFVLCAIWLPFIAFLLVPKIKEILAELDNEKKQMAADLREESNSFLKKTKRNFSIALQDAKTIWKNKVNFSNLPLVMVIGDERAGKSSLINYAELEYPATDSLGNYRDNHHSTKNFNFYISKKGVLIDTEGSFFAYEQLSTNLGTDEIAEDNFDKNRDFLLKKTVWKMFINFLSKTPFHKKLNGIIYVIDCQKFLYSPQEEAKKSILSLVRRIRDCETCLKLAVPIYIVFSKIDLIEGMSDFIGLYDESVSEKIFGVTFSLEEDFTREYVDKELSNLSTLIQNTVIGKNQAGLTQEKKIRNYFFYKQMENLFSVVSSFLIGIERENSSNQSYIRGVYFISSYQENTPTNFIVNSICKRNGIKSPIARGENYPSKSYFVKSLLEDVVFADGELSFSANDNKPLKTYVGIWISLALLSYLSIDYLREKKEAVQADLAGITERIDFMFQKTHIKQNDPKLQYIQEMQGIIDSYPKAFNTPTLLDYLTLNITANAFQPFKTLYNKEVQNIIKQSILMELERALLVEEDLTVLLETFYFYLSIIDGKALNKNLVEYLVAQYWKSIQQYGIPKKTFIDYISDPSFANKNNMNKNEGLIAQTRKKLQSMGETRRLYAFLRLNSKMFRQKIDIRSKISSEFNDFFDNQNDSYMVTEFYTKKGFTSLIDHFSNHLNKSIELEEWFFGEKLERETMREELISFEILKLYAQDYIAEWKRMLENLSLRTSSSETVTLKILTLLSSPSNPISNLFAFVEENTQLSNLDELVKRSENIKVSVKNIQSITRVIADSFYLYGEIAQKNSLSSQGLSFLANKANEKLANSESQNLATQTGQQIPQMNVASNPLRKITEDIQMILSKTISFKQEEADPTAKISYAFSQTQDPLDPFEILKKDIAVFPIEVQKLYLKASEYAKDIIKKYAVGDLEIIWNRDIYSYFINQIAPFYPFNPNSKESLKMETFKNFFGRNGIWKQFFDRNLTYFFNHDGSSYRITEKYVKQMSFSNEFLRIISILDEISRNTLDTNNNLTINFTIQTVALAGDFGKINIAYNQNSINYDQTFATNMDFVTDSFQENSSLTLTTFDYMGQQKAINTYDGQWAWFRFIYSATKKAGIYRIIFNRNPSLYFDFKIVDGYRDLAIALNNFPHLKIPQKIFK